VGLVYFLSLIWAGLILVVVSPVLAAWATRPGFYVSRRRMGIGQDE
jgi:hypothetical protein